MEEDDMDIYRWIKGIPNWKFAAGVALTEAVLFIVLASPHVLVGRESKGLDIRRYSTWMFTTPEPILAEVRKGEYHAQPLLGQYSLEPGINETVTSSRVYMGGNGEFVYVSTDDWGRDGEQDTLSVIVTTGEWDRDGRKVLYAQGWTRTKRGDKLVLFSDAYQGPLTEQEAVAISPDLQKFSNPEGNINTEGLSVNVREEAYSMTKADTDNRFEIRQRK